MTALRAYRIAPARWTGAAQLKWAGYTMVGIGILHLVVLGLDVVPLLGDWLRGALWTPAHWQPLASQAPELLIGNAAFHSTIGSFAGPVIVFGFLLLWMERRAIVPPAFLGWGLGVWAAIAALVMEPSGYPLGLIPAVLIVLAARSART
ncbi:hypothetical protein GCM10007913_32370 [Devosia yakushimensis]|uniref:Uncharacterized protein n=1 Tax=Devosia yakushimensis TaxID=470028 RepID=A0ABQ5UJH0_9HYPH|nr:DUF6463 family protein [Devosia yakushimensis]GLQ11305.1 hypothetical protein GCM10007913_32370 [Devosia yakushimensis]